MFCMLLIVNKKVEKKIIWEKNYYFCKFKLEIRTILNITI